MQLTDTWSLPSRRLASWAAGLAGVAAFTRLAPAEAPAGAALRLVAAAYLVSFLPGFALALALKREERVPLLELLARSFALSIALLTPLTVVSLTAHVGCRTMGILFLGASLSLVLFCSRRGAAVVEFSPLDLALVGAFAVPAALAFWQGSPFSAFAGEDGTHVAVARRLLTLSAPAIDNVYWARSVVYSYVFPVTHYLIALVAGASDLDVLFVYRKLRFLWTLMAHTFVAAGALHVFGTRSMARITGLTAVGLSLSGAFAQVFALSGWAYNWGQLVPFSHAADVAMGVYLPGLIVTSLAYLQSDDASQRRLDLAVALSLVLLLSVAHTREVVQYCVYLTVFLLSQLWLRRDRSLLTRTSVLLALTLIVAASYLTWHKHTVGHIDELVTERRGLLVLTASKLSFAEWFTPPFLNPAFGATLESFFYSIFPVVLLVTPLLLALVRDRAAALFVGSSVAAYLAIVWLPFLAIPYIYLTYFEILFTPVRNVVFFVHVLAGFTLVLVAGAISRVRSGALRALAAVLAAGLLGAAYRWLGLVLAARPGVWFVTLLVLLGAAFLVRRSIKGTESSAGLLNAASPAVVGLLLLSTIAFTASKRSSPLAIDPTSVVKTPSSAIEMACLAEPEREFPYNPRDPSRMGPHPTLRVPASTSCPPPLALVAWAQRVLPTDAVLAVNILNRYSPAPFMPQQIVCWPHIDITTGSYMRRVVPAYYAALDTSLKRYARQPFFNPLETLEERIAFLKSVEATHILVDPSVRHEVMPALRGWPRYFEKLYDANGWAVFAVHSD